MVLEKVILMLVVDVAHNVFVVNAVHDVDDVFVDDATLKVLLL